MYVKIGRRLAGLAEVTEDRYGEEVLILRYGHPADHPMAKTLDELLRDFTTYEAARARLMTAPHTTREAATALGVGWRWIVRQIELDPTFPHTRIGSHTMLLGEHIEEIRQRFTHGELRYAPAGGRPRGIR
jgi:hypothetical protein